MPAYQELQTAKYFAASQEAAAREQQQQASRLSWGSCLKVMLLAMVLGAGAGLLYNVHHLRAGFSQENIENFRRNPLNLLIWLVGSDHKEDAANRAEWRRNNRQRELQEQLSSSQEHPRWLDEQRANSIFDHP